MNGLGLSATEVEDLEREMQKRGVQDPLTSALVMGCNVPIRYAGMSVDTMNYGESVEYRAILARIKQLGVELAELHACLKRPVFLCLKGSFGTGKTRSAVWLLRQAYLGVKHMSQAPYFMTSAQLVDVRFERRGSDEADDPINERRDRAFRSPFLVLDDVARFSGFRGEQDFVERVVDERFNAGRSTVLTSNARDGDLPERFQDLLRGFEELVFKGESHRGEV